MIKIPNFNEEDHAQICLIKKYRTGKGEDKKTNYSFFRIGTHKKISNEIKFWLISHFKKIEDEEIIDYNPSIELEEFEKIDLEGLEVWKKFKEKAFSGTNLGETKLKEMRNRLTGIIIYIKKGQKIYGQIRKIFPRNILYQGGRYLLHFDDSKFNELKEEKGIRFDKKADFIFYSDAEKSEGIILNKINFKSIFDLWEEYKKKALNNSKKIKLFKESNCFNTLYESVGEDRQIQKMLINPVIEKYLNEITYSDLKSLKREVPNLNFDLDTANQDFILPPGKEKEAIRDLIKVVSGKMGFSLNKKHIVENVGVKKIFE